MCPQDFDTKLGCTLNSFMIKNVEKHELQGAGIQFQLNIESMHALLATMRINYSKTPKVYCSIM